MSSKAKTNKRSSPFGLCLEKFQIRQGVSNAQLAKLAHADYSHVTRLHNGQRKPKREMVMKLSDALGLKAESVNELLAAANLAPVIELRGPKERKSTARAPNTLTPESFGVNAATIKRLIKALSESGPQIKYAVHKSIAASFARAHRVLEAPIKVAVIPAAGKLYRERFLSLPILRSCLLSAIREAVESSIFEIVLVLPPNGRASLIEPLKSELAFFSPSHPSRL